MSTAASTTKPDQSKECVITNNCTSDIVILSPTTAQAPGDTQNASVYDQDLEILSLLEGGTVISQNGSGTVYLDQYYTDPNTKQQQYSLVYNLLASTSSWYFPVDNIGVMQNIFGSPVTFPAQTVTTDEQQSIANAATFYQTIAAYPTSQLTQNYETAMNGAQTTAQGQADGSANSSDNVANSITDSVNAFFASTKGFQNVTLAGLVAVESYYSKFPFVWAQYDSTTYYLYSSDGNTTSFVGTLSLTKPSALDLSKPNAGYACTFTPAKDPTDTSTVDVDSSQAKTLTYSNALFVDNVNADIPDVAVKGTFQLKRVFTQNPSDTQIIPVLTGTIAGETCIGFDSPQLSTDQSSEFWNTLFHPKNSAQVFNSIMTIGGAVMMLHFVGSTLYGIFKWVKNRGKAKEPTTEDLFKQQQEAFEKALNEKIDTAVQKLTNGKQNAPEDTESALEEINSERGSIDDNLNAINLEEGLKVEASTLEIQAQYESEMNGQQLEQLESSATSIKNSNDALNSATEENLHDVVTEQTSAFKDIQANTSALTESLDKSISSEQQAQIESNQAASEKVSEDIENSEKNAEEDASNSDPKAEDEIKPLEDF
ncbi:hypothetical protein [Hahella sp. NBU794]|uniref:hypothetical protein n=1 Tax=Hahella sp. NBU794 TaxID=3422590 RepID=UPI003D6E6939